MDQMERFLRAKVVLQPRQLAASAAARLCDAPEGPTAVGYGGARGGGKSHWLLAQMGADDCQRVPGLKCLLLRKVGKANLEHFEDLRRKLFLKLPAWFTVPTPVGEYNPDWAIVLDREGAGERLFLVRETKAEGELRPSEAMKVDCGKAHFEGALGVSYARVTTASEIA